VTRQQALESELLETKSELTVLRNMLAETEVFKTGHQFLESPASRIVADLMAEVQPVDWCRLAIESLLGAGHTAEQLSCHPTLLEEVVGLLPFLNQQLLASWPDAQLLPAVNDTRIGAMLRTVLQPYCLPKDVESAFVSQLSRTETKKILLSPIMFSQRLAQWYEQQERRLTDLEIIEGTSKALATFEKIDLHGDKFSEVLHRHHPSIKQAGILFASTAAATYRRLGTAAKKHLWTEFNITRVSLDRSLLRKTQETLMARLSSISANKAREFVHRTCCGKVDLVELQQSTTEENILQRVSEYSLQHQNTSGSAFCTIDVQRNPSDIPFWTCAGGCGNAIDLHTMVTCVDCGVACCGSSMCQNSSSNQTVCHGCATGARGYSWTQAETPSRTRALNKNEWESRIWAELGKRGVENTQLQTRTARLLEYSHSRLQIGFQKGDIFSEPAPEPEQTPSKSTKRDRGTPGSGGAKPMGNKSSPVDPPQRKRQQKAQPASPAGAVATQAPKDLFEVLANFSPPLDDESREVMTAFITAKETKPLDGIMEKLNILLVGASPIKPECLIKITKQSIKSTDVRNAICMFALQHMRRGGSLWTWYGIGTGPNHVDAEVNFQGVSKIPALIGREKIDRIIFAPSFITEENMREFFKPGGPFLKLQEANLLAGGAYLPQYHANQKLGTYDALLGLSRSVSMAAHPWNQAESVYSQILEVRTGFRYQPQAVSFRGWIYFVPDGSGQPPALFTVETVYEDGEDGDGSDDNADDNTSMHSAASEAGHESFRTQRADGAQISSA
jgi:hypothetical protein